MNNVPFTIQKSLLSDLFPVKHEGNFILESGKVGGTFKENEKLKKEVRRLEEENNLLKLKFDVLLDMVIFFYVAPFETSKSLCLKQKVHVYIEQVYQYYNRTLIKAYNDSY